MFFANAYQFGFLKAEIHSKYLFWKQDTGFQSYSVSFVIFKKTPLIFQNRLTFLIRTKDAGFLKSIQSLKSEIIKKFKYAYYSLQYILFPAEYLLYSRFECKCTYLYIKSLCNCRKLDKKIIIVRLWVILKKLANLLTSFNLCNLLIIQHILHLN